VNAILLNFARFVNIDLVVFVKAENDGLVDASLTSPTGASDVQ